MKLKIEIDSEDDCMCIKEINRILNIVNDRLKLHNTQYKLRPLDGRILSVDGNSVGHFEFDPR